MPQLLSVVYNHLVFSSARASSLRRAVGVLRLLNQFVQGRVDRLRARVADPFVPDDSLVIEDVVGRCAARTPFGGDDSAVRKCTPVQLLLLHYGFEFLRFVSETVDAEEGKRFLCQLFHERPLVRPVGPSRGSELGPEIKQHDLATIVAQLELLTVLVNLFDLQRLPANGQMANLEQVCFRRLRDSAVVGRFHVAVICQSPVVKRLGFFHNLESVLTLQCTQVILSVKGFEAPGCFRLVLKQFDFLEAVTEELGQPQAGQPFDFPVRTLLEHRA